MMGRIRSGRRARRCGSHGALWHLRDLLAWCFGVEIQRSHDLLVPFSKGRLVHSSWTW